MSKNRIVVVIGNPGVKSRTKVLAQAIASRLVDGLAGHLAVEVQTVEIAQLAPHLLASGWPAELPPEGVAAVRAIETADLVIAATPVYKGSYTGLFKHLFDLVGPDALVGRPVLLAANGGSDRHALVVDHQLRPLFSFFRALSVPSAVYAAESDFDGYTIVNSGLKARIAEAAGQAVDLLVQASAQREASLLQRQAA
ncbi:NAD(P)H-dependent oxidoreductase [Roseateles sp.]|uniref:NAD(P)H-dependent oxidoreductase n=1 Tax=Roseateles sp. TaxID=1971397 RepID=UPI0039EBF36C